MVWEGRGNGKGMKDRRWNLERNLVMVRIDEIRKRINREVDEGRDKG